MIIKKLNINETLKSYKDYSNFKTIKEFYALFTDVY